MNRPLNSLTLLLAAALLLPWTLPIPAAARNEQKIDEGKAALLKAAYLRYLAEFTIWPDSAFEDDEAPIRIGVLGEDPHGVFQKIRKAIREKKLLAQRRPIKMIRLEYVPVAENDPPDPEREEPRRTFEDRLHHCHLLFLTDSEEEHWPDVHELVQGDAVVTVSEIEGFATVEGMVEFVIKAADGRIVLHIDLDAVQKGGLRLSSRLLGLKRGVKIVKQPDGKETRAVRTMRTNSRDSAEVPAGPTREPARG